MQAVSTWICRRPWTLGLAVFFLTWYGLQLGVFHFVGENTARWWFYFEKPPNAISPGMLFAPLSHDMYGLGHITSNVVLLLIVGGVAEPYIGRGRILVTVIGLGYLGTYLANIPPWCISCGWWPGPAAASSPWRRTRGSGCGTGLSRT